MTGGLTPRRERRRWNQAPQVSVRDALLTSTRDLSIVSEVSSVCEDETEDQFEEQEPEQIKRPPSVAWVLPVEDFQVSKPDTAIVSCPIKKPSNHSRPRQNKQRQESNGFRHNNRQMKEVTNLENNGRLTGIRSRVRDASELKAKKSSQQLSKYDVNRILSTSRARQKVVKSRQDDFAKTIRLLDSKCSMFRRSPTPEETTDVDEEEACIYEVQKGAFDRWEKAVEVAKQALEEVIEAEKVLNFAAEFEQMKGLMDMHGPDWDVGIDKYIDLYKNLQVEYPETAPIRRSKIVRKQSIRRPNDQKPPLPSKIHHERSRSLDDRIHNKIKASGIPTSITLRNAPPPRFDPNFMLALGRRFAHAAEMWFLKLIHSMVGIEVAHSVYCREDCYRLMESLSKLQNWLLTAKGTTRLDRRDVLLGRLRDTIIRWSSQMFDLPLARTNG